MIPCKVLHELVIIYTCRIKMKLTEYITNKMQMAAEVELLTCCWGGMAHLKKMCMVSIMSVTCTVRHSKAWIFFEFWRVYNIIHQALLVSSKLISAFDAVAISLPIERKKFFPKSREGPDCHKFLYWEQQQLQSDFLLTHIHTQDDY